MVSIRRDQMHSDIQIFIKRNYSLIFALAFWAILVVPLLKPDVSISSFEQTFFGHEMLIERFNTLRLRLGDRVFPFVNVGKDGWLFFTGDRSMDDYQHTNPYSGHDFAGTRKGLDTLYEQLQQRGIMLMVVIAPDKSTVYPEFMPDQIIQIGKRSRLDQFIDDMRRYGKTPVIDLRPDLIEASKTEQVFYKTDTHWNPLGAYVASTKILSVLAQRYPELVPHPLSDYEMVSKGLVSFDMPRIIGLPSLKEKLWDLQPKFNTGTSFRIVPLPDGTILRISWNQNQNLPSALFYHDSFLNGVLPFLEPQFKQTTSIFRSTIPGMWSLKWVDQVHPDIVIIEYVERYLNSEISIPGNQ
jgi:alginate O-acetyltransferase complex protein AlgJ